MPPSFTSARRALLQRKCACGGTPGPTGECEECRKKRLSLRRRARNKENGALSGSSAPPIVHEALRSPGRPLDSKERAFFEPRFGHDFGAVRVHTDARAAASAQAVDALAYTVGREIVFGPGKFQPHDADGRRLLAHELAHTIQQPDRLTANLSIREDPFQEAEADRAALIMDLPHPAGIRPVRMASESSYGVQRKLVVKNASSSPPAAPPGETNDKIVKGYIGSLCPAFTATAGEVVPTNAAFCPTGAAASPAPESCNCLCTMHALRDPASAAPITWTVNIDDTDWPHTDDASRTVTVHSPFSGVQFGAWTKGPTSHAGTAPNWLVLGHELCGHAKLFATGVHPSGPPPTHGGRPSHDVTIGIENKIATEHGIRPAELRGLFADPHHGESFAKVTVAEFPTNSAAISALSPAQTHQIDIAEAFIKSAAVKVDLVGHSDKQATAGTGNAAISTARANSVKAALTSRGIPATQFLAVKGVGEAECAAPGDQPSCRKVEIFMFSMEGASLTHP
jgi:outer membrane protein OmpA-like peptidoglycan-associated protein